MKLLIELASYRASQKESPRLEITDIVVNDYNPDFTAILDFRVINRGGKSLTISRVRFEVIDVEEIFTLGALDFSAKYDLDISDFKQKGDHGDVGVSHVLSADEADRFAIVLTAKNMPMGVFRIWSLKPILITSEGQVVASVVSVGLPWDIRKTSRHPGM